MNFQLWLQLFPSRYSDNNNKKINYIGNLKTEMKNV